MYYRSFEDLEFTPARVLVEGPYAAVEWAESFHFTGEFSGIPADGRELRVRALDVFEVRDGRVVRESGWYGDGWMIERLAAADPSTLPEPLPRGGGWARRAAPDRKSAVSSEGTRRVIDRLFAAAATGDTERVLEWWAEDGVLEDVTIARRFAGRAEMRPYLDEYYRAFPDITFAPSLLIVDGPWALVEWAESCHFVGPFDGIELDGRELRIRAVDLFEIGDGVVQHESSWYGDGWFRQRLESADPQSLPPELPRGKGW
jgi:predicted ester cyclase